MTPSSSVLRHLVTALALLSAASGCMDVEDRRQNVARDVFDRYCSRCHGRSADGPVPVADLGFEATDLRRLYEQYGTPLARRPLAAYIDGRHATAEHEGREMPVWGETLYSSLPENTDVDEMRSGTIDLLIDYLDTIQGTD